MAVAKTGHNGESSEPRIAQARREQTGTKDRASAYEVGVIFTRLDVNSLRRARRAPAPPSPASALAQNRPCALSIGPWQ